MTMGTSIRGRDPATEEEFLGALYKGGELLAAGKVIEARSQLEKARSLQPRHEKALNLLGLTYFKLGLFDRAAEVYEALVRDNPVDPTLRVNLGLVYLKTNDVKRSVKELQAATDLDPEHKKAHNYLGLALAQLGDYARAKDHFVIAGSDAMVERMTRALATVTEPTTATPEPAATIPSPLGPPPAARPGARDSATVEPIPLPAPQPAAGAGAGAREPVSGEANAVGPPSSEGDIEVMSDEELPPPDDGAEPMVAEFPVADVPGPIHADWGSQFGMETPALTASPSDGPPVVDATVVEGDWSGPELAPDAEPMPEPTETSSEGALTAESGPDWSEPPASTSSSVAMWVAPQEPAAAPETAAEIGAEPTQSPEGPVKTSFTSTDTSTQWASLEPASAPSWIVQPAPEPGGEVPAWIAGPESEPRGSGLTEQMTTLEAPVPAAEPEPAPAVTSSPSGVVPAGYHTMPAPRLSDLGTTTDWIADQPAGAFFISAEGLALTIRGELLSRLSGLVAIVGTVDAQPESRRSRGRNLEVPFGAPPNQLQRLRGAGLVYLERGRSTFAAIDLDEEGAYLREDRVFAFEEPVAWENGRLTSDSGFSLDLVHLKGRGKLLLSLEGPLKSMPVPPGTPMVVPLTRVVGWYGHLSPRLVGFAGQGAVELTGDGSVLLAGPERS